ncbi:MAG TPA: hypothetical protein VH879_02230 [Gemmatimonadales bacterium]
MTATSEGASSPRPSRSRRPEIVTDEVHWQPSLDEPELVLSLDLLFADLPQ